MTILVINPPAVNDVEIIREGRCMQKKDAWGTSWAPLSLATIAAVLREAGFDVGLMDCSNDGVSVEQLKSEIKERGAGIVIVNTSTTSIVSDLQIAEVAREVDENIKVVFFGVHPSALAEEVFGENGNVKFIVRGEPEYTLRDFALAVRDGGALGEVKGLVWRGDDGGIVYNEERGFIEDLDELPYPAWDLVNIEGYRLPITNRPFLLVSPGRGCPYPCKFCAASVYYGAKPRLKSWEKVVAEIKHVRETYGINDFLFWSESSVHNRGQIYDIAEGLWREVPGVKWACSGRVDAVDEELLRTMKTGGCWMISYGVEAGTQRVLDLMKKNVKIEDIEEAVRITKKVGIEVTGHIILGYPGERREDVLETIKLVKRLDLDYIQVYCCVPFPGTELYEEAKGAGQLVTSDWSRFEQNSSIISTESLSADEVMELRGEIIRKFYLNPLKIFKTLLKIRSFREVLFFVTFARKYFASWVGGK